MRIGITIGDANGVGPEIALRAAAGGTLPEHALIIGDYSVAEMVNETLSLGVRLCRINPNDELVTGALNIFDQDILSRSDIKPGVLSAATGAAALSYLRKAVELTLDGRIGAVVTLPINKEATRLSEPGFTGHTEVIARMCGRTNYAMTLVTDALVVPHVSAHVSLLDAIRTLNAERIFEVISIADNLLTRLGRTRRIAVLGLNPHAGENGAFGDEEKRHILPAIERARTLGLNVFGPVPPDTAFMRAFGGAFDAVVCMYHDQGHGPMKTVAMDACVNLTAGLPVVRTSVDHGTAFDIAWKGTASLGSFTAACRLAQKLAETQ